MFILNVLLARRIPIIYVIMLCRFLFAFKSRADHRIECSGVIGELYLFACGFQFWKLVFALFTHNRKISEPINSLFFVTYSTAKWTFRTSCQTGADCWHLCWICIALTRRNRLISATVEWKFTRVFMADGHGFETPCWRIVVFLCFDVTLDKHTRTTMWFF